jgi:hypothetical protein
MPLYEYECEKCGGRVEQMISAPAVQFKGSGWYVTDYPKKSQESTSSDGGKDSKKEEKPKAEGSAKESSSTETSKQGSSKESSTKESTTRVSSSRKPDKRK